MDNDELLHHEVVHTASIAQDFFHDHVERHVAVRDNPELAHAAEKITEMLGIFYNLVASGSGDDQTWVKEEKKKFLNRIDREKLVNRLKQYNEWRRGADIPQPAPTELGRDIDMAIKILEANHG